MTEPVLKPRRHSWPKEGQEGYARVLPTDDDANEYSIRTCAICGVMKVTVHPPRGFAFRLWRKPTGETSRQFMPPCAGVMTLRDLSEAVST
jgi:hypothetical protein